MISRKLNNRKESAADHGDPQPITNMVKLAAFLHNGEQYRVYGEFEFKDIKVIAPNEIERTVSLPEFRDLKAVRVKNGKEIAYKPAESVLKFLNSYLTALLLDNKEYIPLYVRGELLQENEYTLKDIFVCEYKDFQVPKFMYLDGEMYTLYLCTDSHIFYWLDDVTLCYGWDKRLQTEGLIADEVLKESLENLKSGKEKLIWDSKIGSRGKLLLDFSSKGERYRIYGGYDFGDADEWHEDFERNDFKYIWKKESGEYEYVTAPDGNREMKHLPVEEDMELDPEKIKPEDEPWKKKKISKAALSSKKPYFYGLRTYTVDNGGNEKEHEPAQFHEEDVIKTGLTDIMLGKETVKKIYMEKGLERWIDAMASKIVKKPLLGRKKKM